MKVHKVLASEKQRSVTIQVTSIEEANKLISNGLFLEAQAFTCERWQADKPTQCFKCGKYGHTATFCRNESRCLTCGGKSHEGDYGARKACLNCKGAHSAYSPVCQVLKAEKERVKRAYKARPLYFTEAKAMATP